MTTEAAAGSREQSTRQPPVAGGPIIARVWHGITSERVAEQHFAHIQETGLPASRAVEGSCGAYVLRRASNGVAEFLVISLWDSYETVRRFTASNDINQAIYYGEDRRYLIFQEPKVAHYELAIADVRPTAGLELNPFEDSA